MEATLRTIVFVVGLICVLEGIVIVIKPNFYRQAVGVLLKGKMVYISPPLKTAFGILFLVAATSCAKPAILIILGIITCTAGIAMFMMGPAKLKRFLNWWKMRGDWFLRLLGVVAVVLGLLISYAAGVGGGA